MSAWGFEPFENDGAADYVYELRERILKDIEENLNSRNLLADDLLWLHAPLALLHILGKETGTPLDYERIEGWRIRVLEILDNDTHQELVEEIRLPLLKTFRRLKRVALR